MNWNDIARYLDRITAAMERMTAAFKSMTATYQELIDYIEQELPKEFER